MVKTLAIVITLICLTGFIIWQYSFWQPTQPEKELKLSDFPEVFKDNTLIVIGDKASEIEIQAVNEIANYLEKETGNKPLVNLENANFTLKAKKWGSNLTITNAGNVTLTNIKIIKEGVFEGEKFIMRKKILKVIPKLDVNESVTISIPTISAFWFLPEEKEVRADNMGWIIVTCDQGITKKMIFAQVVPHTIKIYPTPLEFFVFYILPPATVVFLIIYYINKIRRRKR